MPPLNPWLLGYDSLIRTQPSLVWCFSIKDLMDYGNACWIVSGVFTWGYGSLKDVWLGDDSLRRILKQSMKGNTMLQMRVPREQDLLSVRVNVIQCPWSRLTFFMQLVGLYGSTSFSINQNRVHVKLQPTAHLLSPQILGSTHTKHIY